MDLTRSWARQLFGASGIALVVPLALIGVFVVVALAGGFQGLHDVNQIVAGPALSPGPVDPTSGSGGRTGLPALLGARDGAAVHQAGQRRTASRRLRSGTGPGSRGRHGTTSRSAPRATRPGHSPARGRGRERGHPRVAGHPPGAGASASPGVTSPPPTSPDALASAVAGGVRSTSAGVASATSTVAAVSAQVPAPLGPAGSGASRSLGATAASLLNGVANAITTAGSSTPPGSGDL